MGGINTYGQYMEPTLGKGRIAEYPDHQADSLAAAETIEWGKGVSYDPANPNRAVTFDGTGKFVGVAVANHYAVNYAPDQPGAYAQFDAISVLRKGRIYVEVLEDVTKGEAAVVDNTTGDFRPGDTATTTISAPVGQFKSSAAAGSYAILEINLPGGVI
jgi:hypothetical protein